MQRGPKRKWDLKTAPWVGKRRASETGSVLCSWLTNRDSYCSGKFIIPPIIEGTPLQTNLEPKIEAGKMISLLKGLIFRVSILTFQGNSFSSPSYINQPRGPWFSLLTCPVHRLARPMLPLRLIQRWEDLDFPRWKISWRKFGVRKKCEKPSKRDVICDIWFHQFSHKRQWRAVLLFAFSSWWETFPDLRQVIFPWNEMMFFF